MERCAEAIRCPPGLPPWHVDPAQHPDNPLLTDAELKELEPWKEYAARETRWVAHCLDREARCRRCRKAYMDSTDGLCATCRDEEAEAWYAWKADQEAEEMYREMVAAGRAGPEPVAIDPNDPDAIPF